MLEYEEVSYTVAREADMYKHVKAVAGGSGATSGSLPFTGAEVLPLLGVGAALLVTGTTVLVAGRRRRPSGSAA